MHLQRVQVPDFRVLKDIDISFEKEFSPRIFPLGSLNGGGKSTLLQLMFILLHCSAYPEKHEFIRNLLEGFAIPEGSNKRVVAEFEVWDGEKKVNINFFVYRGIEIFPIDNTSNEQAKETYSEESQELLTYDKRKALVFKENLRLIHLESFITSEKPNILFCEFINIDDKMIDQFRVNLSHKIFLASPSTQIFLFSSSIYRKSLFRKKITSGTINTASENLKKSNGNFPKLKDELSKEWEKMTDELPNFLPYDFFSVDVIIQAFIKARDQDFEEARLTEGKYGNRYKGLLSDFNNFLIDKKINIDQDLLGINFKTERNGKTIELYPEDLSHGELKRLSLYVWLKYSNIENAIILFDEIEIALHPDWQYQIIRDLEEWGPTNQYILATHSYELCQALTPAHVKEIEPKLLNNVNHS
jgi:predicted ATP-dependent endonuclease of OLD family